MEEKENILRMEGICKSFSGIVVLDKINLSVAKGEVHALMGENGAGKSTLMKILAGIHQKDSGKIFIRGKEVTIKSPSDALRLGISMIHQELNPIPDMTVAENIFIGREPCFPFLGIVDKKKQNKMTGELLELLGINIPPDTILRNLSIAAIQMVEIAKAISFKSDIIIMDEPTSALTEKESANLFQIIRKLKASGTAIVYISHKMNEVFSLSDSITVFRDGKHIRTSQSGELNEEQLIQLMVGRDLKEIFSPIISEKGEVAIEVKNLKKEGKFSGINFKVRKGEVLGLAGLMGAGRTEISEAIFGIEPPDSGQILLKGKVTPVNSPADAIKNGIALIPEDRKLKGLNLMGSVGDNISLVMLNKFSMLNQVLDLSKEKSVVNDQIKQLRIKTKNRKQLVSNLSGGNQQKVVLAKWLIGNPDVIIFDEPTRGIDIGAKAEIYQLISKLSREGKCIILISSEMIELLSLSDRIIVLAKGKITDEFEKENFNQEDILTAAMGKSKTIM